MEYELRTTDQFDKWQSRLKDREAAKAIAIRLVRASNGHFGDTKSLGDGLGEMRIFSGKGYRIYFTIRNSELILLLNGGHKGSQEKDIEKARKLLKALEEDNAK